MGFVRDERQAMATTMLQVGPDAPTLCEGWAVRDLAAHIVLRERRLDAAPGIVFPPLAGYTARVQEGIARQDFEELVDQIRQGPPLLSPFRLFDEQANFVEFIVHHEDVRRAQPDWSPRELPESARKGLWSAVTKLGRRAYSSAPTRVVLATPEGRSAQVKPGDGPGVTVRGEPEELILHAFGRDEVLLEFDGPDEQAEAVREMRRTLP